MAVRAHILRVLGLVLTGAPMVAAVEDARVEFTLGILEEIRGVATAAAHFEKARLADPLALPLVQRAVKQRLAAHDRAAAVKLFRDLATARPEDLEVQLLFADFLTEQAQGDTIAVKLATDTLVASLEKYPGSPEVIRRLYAIYQTSDLAAQATKLLDQLTLGDPASALLFATLTRGASEAEATANREKLDRHYLQALASRPELASLARSASDYFRESERPDLAVEVLEKHLAAAPSSLDLRTRLGVLFFAAKQDERGEAVLKQVLEIDPKQALAHQALAKFYRSHEKPALARNHASELLKLRSGSADEFLKLAAEFLVADDPRSARLLLERAVFAYPDHLQMLQKLAIASHRDPTTQDLAPRLFRQAEAAKLGMEKLEPAFLIEFAAALIAQGQSQAAEERLRTAIRAYPPEAKKETAAALRQLASLWESENRNTEAAKALRQRADGLEL
jgi:Flp pilus assembly protein TadD